MNSFQVDVRQFVVQCFGEDIADDKKERVYRFFEEAIELSQSVGMTKEECVQLIDYVFSRKTGEPHQEIGGVLVTLSALCSAIGEKMSHCSEDEIGRCFDNIEKIRKKHFSKPIGIRTPLPGI